MLVVPEIGALSAEDAAGAKKLLQEVKAERVACVNWPESYPDSPEVTFRMAHNGGELFLLFEVKEEWTRALVAEDNGKVWTDSCVEFFVSLDDSGYYNFEFTAAGRLLMGFQKKRSLVTPSPVYKLLRVRRHTSLGNALFADRRLERPWWLLAVIPADALYCHGLESWRGVKARMNVYKCGDGLARRHYLSWQPVDTPKPDFHVERCFGSVYFESQV